MTTRHKLFATWKNQVSPTQSLTLADAAAEVVRPEPEVELTLEPHRLGIVVAQPRVVANKRRLCLLQ